MEKLNLFSLREWDNLVKNTYGKIYSFQQQDDCKSRQLFRFSVPSDAYDYEATNIPEEINGEEMGINFSTWVETNPNYPEHMIDFDRTLFWERNFYPEFQTLANDLYDKGLLEGWDYWIDIDW